MTATKIIIASVISYVTIFSIAYFLFLNTTFTGDAAGSGLAKGLTFLFGVGFLFLLAVILTIVHIYLFRGVTPVWVKLISFIPIVLPTLLFLTGYLGLGKSTEPVIEEQAHRLTIEIKSNAPLENATLRFRTSRGGSSSKLKTVQEVGGVYFYQTNHAIFYEEDRKLSVYSDDFKTPEYYLVMPYEPEPLPFTDWKVLDAMKRNDTDSVIIEFRYTVSLPD
ncbi:MAG TPA: hypothetical protein VGK39_03160 [Cyclobacteriaceae bacterium]